MNDITQCDGYKSLRADVDRDIAKDEDLIKKGLGYFHDYEAKFQWAIERAQHYGSSLGLDAADILDAWEKDRNYWYMNYYQESNQPTIKSAHVRVFETVDELKISISRPQFRCPWCCGVSTDAYTCDSGIKRDGKVCDWKAYGLFGTLGKGVFVYVKERLQGQSIFMPVAWEQPLNISATEAAHG